MALNTIPKNRPIILIGHSYGGDSILKVLPLINRDIQLVVTIDPVGTGGFRRIATSRRVPSNVQYFMNRWQENGLAGDNIVPFDSRSSGSIPCGAKSCDQQAQNLARNADGSEIRVSCGPQEVSCEGWRLPGCNFGGCWKGSNGTKAKRMFHNDMPVDASIQRSVGDRVISQLASFRPPSLPSGNAQNPPQPSQKEDQYLVGDWDGDGKDNIAVRRGSRILMDFNYDGAHDREQSYGQGNGEDQYLVGDWDGDGKDNIAVRRGSRILMDFNYDGAHDREQSYGGG